ncbi:MAG: glycosyl transferase [Chryseobacterium sp.]|nr:MAG: glycosyl transferase [Chryseobacterium sp.]
MVVAHIILAHSKPAQLNRLIKKLNHPDSLIFVQLDKKCNLVDYPFLLNTPNVELIINRFDVRWGGFSQVKAIMAAIKQVVQHQSSFGHINLISGQDYPIKPSQDFIDFLKTYTTSSFLEFHLPGHPWIEMAQGRITKYHLTDHRFKGSVFLEKLINFFTPVRRIPSDFIIVGHSTWFTLAMEAAKYLVEFFETEKHLISKFDYSWGADEILIQSILYNSRYRDQLVNNNLRYIDWSKGGANPKILTIEDSSALTSTRSFFARKFDMEVDIEILNYIDQNIL